MTRPVAHAITANFVWEGDEDAGDVDPLYVCVPVRVDFLFSPGHSAYYDRSRGGWDPPDPAEVEYVGCDNPWLDAWTEAWLASDDGYLAACEEAQWE